MPELWTPHSNNHTDVTNPFDMMVYYQDEINAADTNVRKQKIAKEAIEAISWHFIYLKDDLREVNISTSAGFISENGNNFEELFDVEVQARLNRIGSYGDDGIVKGLSLGMAAFSYVHPQEDSFPKIVMGSFATPVRHIRQITYEVNDEGLED